MALRHFKPARFPPGLVPNIQRLTYDNGETFVVGAVLIAGASNRVQEGGADPSPIIGVAMDDAGSAPGYELGHSSQVTQVTHREQSVSVAIADRIITWSGSATVAAVEAHVGVLYGIVSTSGIWQIDISETTNTAVEIVDVDVGENIHYFKWLEADLAQP